MTMNIAHRGFSAAYPENTMMAFQKAIEAQCDGIELDLHLTRDGEIIVFHDESVDRITNGRGFVRDMDYPEIRKLDAGKGEHIPALDEYFDLAEKTGIITIIELKNNVFPYNGMEEKIIEKIRRRKMEGRVLLSSTNHFSVLKCKKLAPDMNCGFIVQDWMIDAGAYSKKHAMDSVHTEFHSLTDGAMAEIRSHGVEIHTWTVNDPACMKQLASRGVDSITTDDPKLLREILNQYGNN